MSSNATSSGAIPLWSYSVILCAQIAAVSLLQLLTLPVFILTDYRWRSSHQIMFCIGLSDLMQIVPYFGAVFCCAVGVPIPTRLGKIAGSLNIVGWDALVAQHLLLALNRSTLIIRSHFRPAFVESLWEKTLFKVLNAAVLCWALCTAILFETPLPGTTINANTLFIGYDLSLPFSHIYSEVEFPYSMTVLGIAFCLYLSIVVILKKQKTTSSNDSVHMQHRAQEWRILFLAIVLFSGAQGVEFGWVFCEDFCGPLQNQLYYNYFIAYCGLNPVLYLVLNPDFRERFLRMYCPRKANGPAKNVVAVVPNDQPVNVRSIY